MIGFVAALAALTPRSARRSRRIHAACERSGYLPSWGALEKPRPASGRARGGRMRYTGIVGSVQEKGCQ